MAIILTTQTPPLPTPPDSHLPGVSVDSTVQPGGSGVAADSAVVTATAVTSSTDSVAAPMAKWLVWVQDATTTTDVTAYEIFAASNGTDVDFNRFGILKLGAGVTGATVTVSQSGANIVLAVTTVGSANITIKRVAVAA